MPNEMGAGVTGAPERIRTSDLCLRRAALYPAELRVRSMATTMLTRFIRACRRPAKPFAIFGCAVSYPAPPVISRNTSSRSASTVVTSPIVSPLAATAAMISAACVADGS